jgi:hypothetical protein
MRFLLHPRVRTILKDGKRSEKVVKIGSFTPVSPNDSTHVKAWGQQCSHQCGCVVRFEAKIDPSTQLIVESTYIAKSIIATLNKGGLEPLYTTRSQRPMFKECSCKTIHQLAKQVTEFLPKQRLDRVQNMTEFTMTRSSIAFRHAVLAENKLPRTDTHCFDLLEEAFTAMIKGHMVKSRRNRESFRKSLSRSISQQKQYDDATGETFGSEHGDGSDGRRLSLSSPRTMSALRMFDINIETWELDQQQDAPPSTLRFFDSWVSYVDELYLREQSA